MNKYINGDLIKTLREKYSMTQEDLAKKLFVSSKAVSKWENNKGYPDISLLEPLSKIFNISINELLSGNVISNTNTSANVLKSLFYVCPLCGNVFYSLGQGQISCHGISLLPLEYEEVNKENITINIVEDEYFIDLNHKMTKEDYISFIAAVSNDRIQILKLYPQGPSQGRFKINSVRLIYFYSNREGLYRIKIK